LTFGVAPPQKGVVQRKVHPPEGSAKKTKRRERSQKKPTNWDRSNLPAGGDIAKKKPSKPLGGEGRGIKKG